MDDRACGKFAGFAPQAKIVHIDIDPAEIGKNVRVDVPIVGDVKRVLTKLDARDRAGGAAESRGVDRPDSRVARAVPAQAVPGRHARAVPAAGHPGASIEPRAARRSIVADVGQHQMFAAQHYQYDEPYTYITSGGLGTMGYSLPAAIGAQLARPDKQVWCVVGDGCFQMTLQELAVLAVHRCRSRSP